MKWDIKLFIISILTWLFYGVTSYFLDDYPLFPPIVVSFYTIVVALCFLVTMPFTLYSFIIIAFVIGTLGTIFTTQDWPYGEVLLWGNILTGFTFAVVLLRLVVNNSRLLPGQKALIGGYAILTFIQLALLFFAQQLSFSMLAVTVVEYILAGVGVVLLLIAPQGKEPLTVGQQRVFILLTMTIIFSIVSELLLSFDRLV